MINGVTFQSSLAEHNLENTYGGGAYNRVNNTAEQIFYYDVYDPFSDDVVSSFNAGDGLETSAIDASADTQPVRQPAGGAEYGGK